MIAVSDECSLYLLEFVEKGVLQRELKKLATAHHAKIIEGKAVPINLIKQELKAYFAGTLIQFKTPLYLTFKNKLGKRWCEFLMVKPKVI